MNDISKPKEENKKIISHKKNRLHKYKLAYTILC